MIPMMTERWTSEPFRPEKHPVRVSHINFDCMRIKKVKSNQYLPLRRFAPTTKVTVGMAASLRTHNKKES